VHFWCSKTKPQFLIFFSEICSQSGFVLRTELLSLSEVQAVTNTAWQCCFMYVVKLT
jgi:hypothetical protein